MTMLLETMQPDPDWDARGCESAIETLRSRAGDLTIHIWGGDWCGDCQDTLPGVAASFVAAGIDPATTRQYPVEKADDGTKHGPKVDEYDIEYIPTIVIERDGTEVARFVESAPEPPIVVLAEQLESVKSTI